MNKQLIAGLIGFVVGLGIMYFLLPANKAEAAMPNFIGTGYYYAPDHVCDAGDRPVSELVNGSPTITGCIEKEAHEAAQAAARTLQNTGFQFGSGESVQLRAGGTSLCPAWFGKNMGCVIDRALIIQ